MDKTIVWNVWFVVGRYRMRNLLYDRQKKANYVGTA